MVFTFVSHVFHYFSHEFHTHISLVCEKLHCETCENGVKWCQPFHTHFHCISHVNSHWFAVKFHMLLHTNFTYKFSVNSYTIWISHALPKSVLSNISKTSASVSSGFQTRETFETTRPQAEWFYCFRAFGNWWNPKHEFLKLLL